MPQVALFSVRVAALGLAWATLAGCAQILDIEEAVCAPSQDPTCPGGQLPPVAGSGGSTVTAGTGGAAGSGGSAGGGGMPAGSGGAGGAAGMPEQAGSGGEGQGGSEPVDTRTPCEIYCDTIADNCSGTLEQYESENACLQACATFEAGQAGDTMVNTLACRQTLAEAAGDSEPDFYCPAAGPGGNGLCGSNCDGFCTMMTATCTELGSQQECLQACEEVPDLSDPSNPGGAVNYNSEDMALQDGDTVQCRIYHVNAAALMFPEIHCPHAAGVERCVE